MILAFFYNINVYCHHPSLALVKSGEGENKKLLWGLTFKWAKLFEVGWGKSTLLCIYIILVAL